MSVTIQATGISRPNNNVGSIEHAITAAKGCIEAAQVALDDIDLLISVGVYRDHNMCEPAIAALIQNALGINLNPVSTPVERTILSFDLMNGACGMLNAFQVASSILNSKQLKRALLVSGEGHPSKEQSDGFPIFHSGAAVLIERTSGKNGFQKFVFETSSDIEGQIGVLDLNLHGAQSRFNIEVLRDDGYMVQLEDFTAAVVERFLIQQGVDKEKISMVTSQPCLEFAEALSRKTGVALAAGAQTVAQWGDTHTAALGLGAHLAFQDINRSSQEGLLFVGAGAGLTSGCGLYLY